MIYIMYYILFILVNNIYVILLFILYLCTYSSLSTISKWSNLPLFPFFCLFIILFSVSFIVHKYIYTHVCVHLYVYVWFFCIWGRIAWAKQHASENLFYVWEQTVKIIYLRITYIYALQMLSCERLWQTDRCVYLYFIMSTSTSTTLKYNTCIII